MYDDRLTIVVWGGPDGHVEQVILQVYKRSDDYANDPIRQAAEEYLKKFLFYWLETGEEERLEDHLIVEAIWGSDQKKSNKMRLDHSDEQSSAAAIGCCIWADWRKFPFEKEEGES